jgi:hypothetical protein
MSSFLYFCFYENLQELNGVRTRMNGGRNEFYFLESRERREFGAIRYFKESIMNRLINSKQIREWADKLKSQQGLII